MPTYASGLSGQVGAVAETTYGTPVTVTHFYEFLSENFQFVPAFLDGAGLKSGQAYNRATRTVVSQFDVNGDLTMEHTSGEAATAVADSMGFWWKWALGSALTTPVVVLGTAFKQIHTNGSKAGQYITCQVGRPQISGVTVQPFTYTGVKCTDWEFSCNDNQIAQLKVTFDGQTELTSTGLAAASLPHTQRAVQLRERDRVHARRHRDHRRRVRPPSPAAPRSRPAPPESPSPAAPR